jgi:hypothetical protein
MAEAPEALADAIGRLDRALAALENRFRALRTMSARGEGDLFDQDRARLAADLDAARSRERVLEEAAEEASAALGRAASQVRALLNEGA